MEFLVASLMILCIFSFKKHSKIIDGKKIGVARKKHRRRSKHRLSLIY